MYIAFLPQLALMMMIIALCLFLIKKKKAGMKLGIFAVAIICTLLCITTQPLSKIKSFTIKEGDSLSIAFFNVLFENKDYPGVIEPAKELNADLIIFQETSDRWIKELHTAFDIKYPYQLNVVTGRSSYLKQVLFSRYPISKVKISHFNGYPMLQATIQLQKTQFRLFSFHAMVPRDKKHQKLRDKQLQSLTESITNYSGIPVIFAGDLNTVPWDPALLKFKSVADMADSRNSFNFTFAVKSPWGKVPIDYIMGNHHIRSREFKTIKTSADHRGVFGVFQVEEMNLKGRNSDV